MWALLDQRRFGDIKSYERQEKLPWVTLQFQQKQRKHFPGIESFYWLLYDRSKWRICQGLSISYPTVVLKSTDFGGWYCRSFQPHREGYLPCDPVLDQRGRITSGLRCIRPAYRYYPSSSAWKTKEEADTSLSLDSISLLKFPEKKKKPAVPAASKPVHTKNTISGPEPVQKPASVFPEKQPYSAALAAKAKEDDAFADVIFEAETYFRKELSVNDIEILIYIHDQLGFSTEIMEYLIEYCVSIEKPDLRYAEGIAKNWYQAGIHTLEEAKEAAENGNPLYRAVFKALGINRKAPTTGEVAWMDS